MKFSVLKVLERLGVELNTAPVKKRNIQGKVECSVCKKFYTAGYLDSHMERKHGEKNVEVEDMVTDVEHTSSLPVSQSSETYISHQ